MLIQIMSNLLDSSLKFHPGKKSNNFRFKLDITNSKASCSVFRYIIGAHRQFDARKRGGTLGKAHV